MWRISRIGIRMEGNEFHEKHAEPVFVHIIRGWSGDFMPEHLQCNSETLLQNQRSEIY
jgi:hypothetical protein